MELWRLPATEMARLIELKELSPVELAESALSRISECEPTVNAFVTVLAEQARDRARSAESEIAGGNYRGPLHGIPVAIKDVIDTSGVPTTCSSKVRENDAPDRDPVVVASLKNAGAIIIGKTHTHELAYGGITPQTRNPRD